MSIIHRNNVTVNGTGGTAMVFAHGFGCDRNMWRFIEPHFRMIFERCFLITSALAGPTFRRTIQRNIPALTDTRLILWRSAKNSELRKAYLSAIQSAP